MLNNTILTRNISFLKFRNLFNSRRTFSNNLFSNNITKHSSKQLKKSSSFATSYVTNQNYHHCVQFCNSIRNDGEPSFMINPSPSFDTCTDAPEELKFLLNQKMSQQQEETTLKLDKSLYNSNIDILAVKVPTRNISTLNKKLKGHLIDRKKIKALEDIEDCSDYKNLLLHEKYATIESIPENVMQILKDNEASEPFGKIIGLTYDHLSSTEVLSKIIPNGLEITSSFEQVGHIAHLNIPDEIAKYKYLIGQVILDKNPKIKTVVNKMGMIDSVFREFKMELLCGEDDFNVTLKENGITFKFNYREVYWNSRLGTEHTRLLKYFDKSQSVCDMMAGVGPFAVPAAKKVECKVYANDLNPKSYEYMKINASVNKVEENMECFNMDGREFIKYMVNDRKVQFHHVIMNLPASAVEFLDVFRADQTKIDFEPIIHCYTFVKGSLKEGDDLTELSKKQVEQFVGADHVGEYIDIYPVRNVAPKKEMMCISFRLRQPSNLKRKVEDSTIENEPEDKKVKL